MMPDDQLDPTIGANDAYQRSADEAARERDALLDEIARLRDALVDVQSECASQEYLPIARLRRIDEIARNALG